MTTTAPEIIGHHMHKGPERYVCLYRDCNEHRTHVLRTLGRWASDKDLSFTWDDAVRMGRAVNGQRECDHVADANEMVRPRGLARWWEATWATLAAIGALGVAGVLYAVILWGSRKR
jgi:hypothetical protein